VESCLFFIGSDHLHEFHEELFKSRGRKEKNIDMILNSEEFKSLKETNIDIAVLIYVDDILFIGKPEFTRWFLNKVQDKFKIKHKSKAKDFIGISINQTGNHIVLDQKKLIDELVSKVELKNERKIFTPIIDDNSNESTTNDVPLEEPKYYQMIIGSLNYLNTCTRPDLAYAVCCLSQKQKNPMIKDLNKALRTIQYLKTKRDLVISFSTTVGKEVNITIYVDSSFSNSENRRSIFGYVIYMNKNILHWRSKVTPLTTTSSTESEFIAAAISIKDVNWIYRMLAELNIWVTSSIIYVDNQGAVRILNSESSTALTRHLDIRLQFAKQFVLNGLHTVRYVNTQDNIADVFTKSLYRLQFEKLIGKFMTEDVN